MEEENKPDLVEERDKMVEVDMNAHGISQPVEKEERDDLDDALRRQAHFEDNELPDSPKELMKEGVMENNAQFSSVAIKDPEVVKGNWTAHVSYYVHVLRVGKTDPIVVRRRYRDFDWLRKRLVKEYPGRVVPPIPPKHIPLFQDSLNAEFVENRRRGLEKFLKRTCEHGDLSSSSSLAIFLGSSEDGLEQARKQTRSTAFENLTDAAKRQSTRLFNYKEFQQMEQQDIERNHDFYDRVAMANEYIDLLGDTLTGLRKAAAAAIHKRHEWNECLEALGLSFNQLASCETTGTLTTPLNDLHKCAEQLVTLNTLHAENERLLFEETLKDWELVTGAVREVMRSQDTARYLQQDVRKDLEKAVNRRDKVRQRAATEQEIRVAEEGVAEAEAAVHESSLKLGTIKKLLFKEMARFNKEKGEAFEEMIYNYVEAQVEVCQKNLAAWETVKNDMPARFRSNSELGPAPGPDIYSGAGEIEVYEPEVLETSIEKPTAKIDLSTDS